MINYVFATIIQGRKLLIIRRFLLRKLIKGGNYSSAETIRGNTVPTYSPHIFVVGIVLSINISRFVHTNVE